MGGLADRQAAAAAPHRSRRLPVATWQLESHRARRLPVAAWQPEPHRSRRLPVATWQPEPRRSRSHRGGPSARRL